MPINLLLGEIQTFHNNQECFSDILIYFKSKIKYLSYKLKYPEAETDLIIYLYELLGAINEEKFSADKDLLMYINKCLKNKSISLFHKQAKDKESISFTSETEILDVINFEEKSDEYSDVIFNDLISSLNPRQAVNKTQRAAFKILKAKLLY